MGRLQSPEALQDLNIKRRDDVDDDDEEATLIREAIVEQLKASGRDYKTAGVKFKTGTMAQIVNGALNERLSTTAVTTKLKAIGLRAIPELTKGIFDGCTIWKWIGLAAKSADNLEWVEVSISKTNGNVGDDAKAKRQKCTDWLTAKLKATSGTGKQREIIREAEIAGSSR